MKTLLKTYNIKTMYQYYQIVSESYINGQRSQAIEQFMAMNKKHRKEMVSNIIFDGTVYVGPDMIDKKFFFDLLG